MDQTPPTAVAAEADTPPPPPRCLGCAYVLEGLPSPGHCPECGWPFDLTDPTTYTMRLPFVRWVFWLPALALSVGGGLLVALILVILFDDWGIALWFCVPFSMGAVLAYRARIAAIFLPILGAIAGLGFILGLVTVGLAGFFCALILVAFLFVPIASGMVAGALLRLYLRKSGFSQRDYLPTGFFFLLPLLVALALGPDRPIVIETVSTSASLNAAPAEVWNNLIFYEEVRHRPPLILRIGLARPLYTTGSARAAGDEKVCIYNRGHITKRIEEALPNERLVFQIIDQQIGYERDIKLTGGSFVLMPISETQTQLTLTTTYRPLLAPRWAWRWGERYGIRTLHNHVLEGIAQEIADQRQAREDRQKTIASAPPCRNAAAVERGSP